MFEKTNIEDLLVFSPKVFEDSRGHFYESYNSQLFSSAGINTQFVQDNRSFSQMGTLRGLHYQTGDCAQAKLVTVLSGHVFDVAVDLRPDSKTYLQWFGIHLKAEDKKSLYIPRGFAHGFLVISEAADFFYKVDNFYSKDNEAGIKYDDPRISIDWPDIGVNYILSDKDLSLPCL